MDSSKKLYISLAVLAALAGVVYLQSQKKTKLANEHSLATQQAELPKLEVSEEAEKAADSITISTPAVAGVPAEGEKPAVEPKPAQKIVLKKAAEDKWELAEPVAYAANTANVKSLLESLKKLKVQEQVSTSTDAYAKWKVDDEAALHATVKQGDKVLLDAYFGDSGSRGQMVRLAGVDGVYAVKGYSKFMFDRDTAAWRDKMILKFEEKDVETVLIKNETGNFEFKRTDGGWTGTLKGAAIADFKPSKVDDMLRAYKSLTANAFGDGKTVADVGLSEPRGTVTIGTKDAAAKYVIAVGDNAETESRWVKSSHSETLFSIGSWSADWATADVSKFQDKEVKEGGDPAPAAAEKQDHRAHAPATP